MFATTKETAFCLINVSSPLNALEKMKSAMDARDFVMELKDA
jgi:hypothetical protein